MTTPDDKPTRIMKAAEQLFATKRFHEITTDDIARAAHVGKGTIYRYFDDKEDLFFQTVTAGFDELCALIEQDAIPVDAALLSADDFEGRLIAMCRQISGFFDRRRQLFRMMQAEDARLTLGRGESRQRWLARREKLVEAVASILARGIDAGHLRHAMPPDLQAHLLLGLLRARVHGVGCAAGDKREGPGVAASPAITHEQVVELFLHGMKTPLRGGRRQPAPRQPARAGVTPTRTAAAAGNRNLPHDSISHEDQA